VSHGKRSYDALRLEDAREQKEYNVRKVGRCKDKNEILNLYIL
jgi:hypothetical protein